MKSWLILILVGFAELSFATPGLRPIPEGACDKKPSEKIDVGTMPSVGSIDTVGLCYADVTAQLINKEICRSMNLADCTELPLDKKASSFDLTRYQNAEVNDPRTMREEFEGIDVMNGGNVKWVLANSIGKGRRDGFLKESCAPFDQIVAKVSDPSVARATENKRVKNIQKIHSQFSLKSANCDTCGREYMTATSDELKDDNGRPISPQKLLESYGIRTSPEKLLEAFAADTYDKTLDALLIPDECWDPKEGIIVPPKLSVNGFPARKEDRKYDAFISVIKNQVKKKVPVAVSFCMQEPFVSNRKKDCNEAHAVAIKGYCRVCDNNGNNCVDAIQIQNSWGAEWQNRNSNGWVYAEDLLKRTSYLDDTLVWIDNENAAPTTIEKKPAPGS